MRGSLSCFVISCALAGCWHGHRDDADACSIVLVRPGNVDEEVGIRPTMRLEWSTEVDISSARVSLREIGGQEIPVTLVADSERVAAVTTNQSLRFDTVYTLEVEPIAARDDDDGTCLGSTTSFHTLAPYEVEQPLRPASLESLVAIDHYLIGSSRSYRGLQVFNIEDPDAPELVATLQTDVHVAGIAVAGNRAYVPAEHDGVLVVDVSDPSTPRQIGHIGTPGIARAVAPFERAGVPYIAIADGVEGVRIMDVSDAVAPRTVALFDPSGARAADVRSIDVDGTLLAIADGTRGYSVVDLTTPAAPTLLGAGVVAGVPAIDVAIVDGLLYVAHFPAFVDIYDPGIAGLPRVGGTRACDVCMQRFPVQLHKAAEHLHVTAAREGVRTYQLDGVGGMTLLGARQAEGPAYAVVETAGRVYVGEEGGLAGFDAGSYGAPRSFPSNGHGTVASVEVVGDLAYVAASSRGLHVFQLVEPEVPVLSAVTPTPASPAGDTSAAFVTMADGTILVGDVHGGLVAFDQATAPMAPTMIGQLLTHDGVTKMVPVRAGVVIGCQGNTGMFLADISNAASPQLLAESFFRDVAPSVPDYCNDIVYDDARKLAYVAGNVGLTVLEVGGAGASEPLRVVGRFPLPSRDVVASIAQRGHVLYAATRVLDFEGRHGVSNRLQVLDLADPAQPAWRSTSSDLGQIGCLVLVGDKLFSAARELGVYVFDVSEAEHPVVEYLIPTRGDATSFAATSRALYVAESTGGLGVVHTGPLPVGRD